MLDKCFFFSLQSLKSGRMGVLSFMLVSFLGTLPIVAAGKKNRISIPKHVLHLGKKRGEQALGFACQCIVVKGPQANVT